MKLYALIALLLAWGATPAWATDAAVGGQLAQRWCTSCHIIGTPAQGNDGAPVLPPAGDSQKWLRAWLQNPHPPMPNPNLSSD